MAKGRKESNPPLKKLKHSEREVFKMVARRKPLEEIALKVGLSEETVSNIIHDARFAFGANDDLIDDYFDMLDQWEAETGGGNRASRPLDAEKESSPSDRRAGNDKIRALEDIEASLTPDQMRDLAGSLMRLADAIDQDWNPHHVQSSFHWPSTAAKIERNSIELAKRAKLLVRQNEQRTKFLPDEFFGEPAWNILLDLFIQFSGGAKVSSKSLCMAAGCPQTTAMRYIERLELAGLIEREASRDDRRVALFSLTKSGVVGVGRILERLAV